MDNNNNRDNNRVVVEGIVEGDCQFSHEKFGKKFYTFSIGCKRESSIVDHVPVMVSNRLFPVKEIKAGDQLSIEGQFRSFNEYNGTRNRLCVHVFATEIYGGEEIFNKNEIFLDGYLCKKPGYRKTPLGREVADILLVVNRAYGKSDYIPCICWGRNARYADSLEVGCHVKIYGRVQSREYMKKLDENTQEIRTAYEVSIMKLEVITDEEQSD